MKIYKKTCKVCRVDFISSAKSTVFCSAECRHKFRQIKNPKICLICGDSFGARRPSQKYCSKECQWASQAREHFYACLSCGKEYSAKAIGRSKYCSRDCAFSHKSKLAADLRASKVNPAKEYQKNCDTCGQSFASKRPEKKYCSTDCSRIANLRRKYPLVLHCCPECGKDFTGRKSAIYCCDACSHRAGKRERKHRMRAKNCAGKNVITIEKLGSRDGWRCGVCGKKIKPDAPRVYPSGPSIDHIIPLSKGGDHSWSNVQIAHISCNTKKNNRVIVSQLRLNMEISYANA